MFWPTVVWQCRAALGLLDGAGWSQPGKNTDAPIYEDYSVFGAVGALVSGPK